MSVVVPNSVAAMGLQAAALRKRIAAQLMAQRQHAALTAQTQGAMAPDPAALQQAQLAQQQQAAQQQQMQVAAEEEAQRKLALQQQLGGA